MESIGDTLKRERNIEIIGGDRFTRGGFTQVPNAILMDNDLSHRAKIAYAILLSYAWQDEGCYPGQEKMAERMGVDARTVRRMLSELQDKGFLDVKQRGLGKTNFYKLKVTVAAKRVRS